jgi:hypothetical protein
VIFCATETTVGSFEVAAVETSVGLSHVTISGRIMKQEAAALETTLKDAFPTS